MGGGRTLTNEDRSQGIFTVF